MGIAKTLRPVVGKALRRAGLMHQLPTMRDVDPWMVQVWDRVAPFTMTPASRVVELCAAVVYLERYAVDGAFVECGVARGGSVMAMALALQHGGSRSRDIYAFDTFEGQPKPSGKDADLFRPEWSIEDQWKASQEGQSDPISRFYAPLERVQQAVESTDYPPSLLHFVKGPVEDTVPSDAPEQIALLRLDTDWYESTRHELEHLYPRLAVGGVLIVDDYGQYAGARQAVDEYFADRRILLNRIDESARIGVKQP
jgi:O-methyltransferase